MKIESKMESISAEDLTEAGYKPVTVWIPDVSDPDFIAAYKQQRAVISDAAKFDSEIDWWEKLQTDEGWV